MVSQVSASSSHRDCWLWIHVENLKPAPRPRGKREQQRPATVRAAQVGASPQALLVLAHHMRAGSALLQPGASRRVEAAEGAEGAQCDGGVQVRAVEPQRHRREEGRGLDSDPRDQAAVLRARRHPNARRAVPRVRLAHLRAAARAGPGAVRHALRRHPGRAEARADGAKRLRDAHSGLPTAFIVLALPLAADGARASSWRASCAACAPPMPRRRCRSPA